MKRLWKGCAAAVFWLLVWEAAALAVKKPLLLPGPDRVLPRLGALALTGEFWSTVGLSLLRVVCGMGAALALGVLLAAACCRFRAVMALTAPLMAVIKSTPVASFIILALLWMGRDILPGFISALIVLPVVFANVSAGIRETDPGLREVAKVFRFSPWKTLSKLYVPSVLPYFRSACRSSLGMGWKAGVAAEVLTLPALSIGKRLYESKLYLETVDLFAWTLAVILCSLAIEALLSAALGKRKEGGQKDA